MKGTQPYTGPFNGQESLTVLLQTGNLTVTVTESSANQKIQIPNDNESDKSSGVILIFDYLFRPNQNLKNLHFIARQSYY